MDNNSIQASITIQASQEKVWDVLTNADKIRKYVGSDTKTDWAVGSPISWSGDMQGITYQNKGQVLENKPHSLLKFTYWSGMGGDADLPENYSEITYTLKPLAGGSVELTYSRVKIPTVIEKEVFESQLPAMLEEIKKLAEE